MLNISDDNDSVELLDLVFSTDIKSAIKKFREMVANSVSAVEIINALIDDVHVLACLKANVSSPERIVSEEIFSKLKILAEKVSLASISKIWQMLLKGVNELKFSERPEIVLEMLLIRIAYASELPDLQELVNGIVKNTNKPLAKSAEMPHTESGSGSLVNETLRMFPGAKLEQ
jgi:DNA polymerase-3 subunit gamma/tau